MAEEFKILTAREHARARIGMYMGSAANETVSRFVMGKWTTVSYVPAILKMIDEIIDNSVDEAIRTQFKHANKIDVTVEGDVITVEDNGRGIPQDEILEGETGEKILRPVAAWTRTNAGTSFSDERTSIGANGLGSAVTNFLSETFVGKTWRDGKLITVSCSNGAETVEVKTSKKVGSGTLVQFKPDFSLFEGGLISDSGIPALVQDRLYSLSVAFPEVVFSFNGKKVPVSDIKKYAAMFDCQNPIVQKSETLSFFFGPAPDGFQTNSFINGVNTRLGGSYVDYIMNGVIEELVNMIKKKHKIEVGKSVIKGGITFIMFARSFVNARYDSQTKERLTNTVGEVKKHFESAGVMNIQAIAKKIMATEEIIQPIIHAQLMKKAAADAREAAKAQKSLKKIKVAKHIAANSSDATLCLVEGDSALGFLLKVRDPKKIGAYPLRGVVMNTWDLTPKKVLENKELSELISILGLDINDPDSVDSMTYSRIATLTDADYDGQKIATLLVVFFYKFWPRLLTEGRVGVMRSPIMIAKKGKEEKWFFDQEEAKEFKNLNGSFNFRYLKGLGTLTEIEYDRVINNPVVDTIEVDDESLFEMMFGEDAQRRKEFMIG